MSQITINSFLSNLLELQQDGSQAISAPSNWVRDLPILHVRTKLDAIVESLATSIRLETNGGATARWHFFVGSPGNGKSAAAGALARALDKVGCRITDEMGTSLKDIPKENIPYLLHVFEGQNKFATTWLAQDASVVRNPYSVNADPASELLRLVQEAAEHRVSLVVCTNRGVLEKAYRSCYLDKDKTKEPWFIALKAATEGNGEVKITLPIKGKKSTYSQALVTSEKLDKVSLLLHSDVASRLIEVATSAKNWSACGSCAAIGKCPFYNNRQWLSSVDGAKVFVGLLQKTELLSGQIIVFRELNALLSLILAGCPKDYEGGTPCSWVHDRLANGDIFPLVARRIYMVLFSAFAPVGLELDDDARQEQCRLLNEIVEDGPALPPHVMKAITKSTLSPWREIASTDVGVQRLLKQGGAIALLDPINDTLPATFLDRWGIERRSLAGKLCGELEEALIEIFSCLADRIEASVSVGPRHYYWLARWYSSLSFRLGALEENRLNKGSELQRLVDVLNALTSLHDPAMLDRVASIERELVTILLGGSAGIKVSEYGRLKGDWVTEKLRPKVKAGSSTEELGLPLRFGSAATETLNAEAFSWLLRKLERGMSAKTFPLQHLETVQDALTRAAATSNYSIADDDVALEATLPNGNVLLIRRLMGHVTVDER